MPDTLPPRFSIPVIERSLPDVPFREELHREITNLHIINSNEPSSRWGPLRPLKHAPALNELLIDTEGTHEKIMAIMNDFSKTLSKCRS